MDDLDFLLICRCCLLRLEDGHSLKPLFGSAIDAMLREVTDIDVMPGDGLPHQVCVQCVLQISRAHTLRTQCQRSDTILRAYLDKHPISQDDHEPCPADNQKPCPADDQEETEFMLELNSGQFLQLSCGSVDPPSTSYPGLIYQDPPGPPVYPDDLVREEIEADAQLTCDNCCMTYPTSSALAHHQAKVHGQDRECDICNKTFRTQKAIRRHMRIHLALKPHTCSECQASFADPSNLRKHMKKHTGELRSVEGKPLTCKDCGKRFKWASSLTKHRKHHTGRGLRCNQCPKVFVEANALLRHARTHSGETPHVCSVCGHGFSQESNLRRHMLTHTQEKPFSCGLCPKTFRQRHHLTDHMKTHTKERESTGQVRHTCSLCQSYYPDAESLKVHERLEHVQQHQQQNDLEAMEILRDELLAEMEGRELRQRGHDVVETEKTVF